MAFGGVGGSVNLGSATGYLFIDATNMSRGIRSADSVLADFAKATEKRAEAIAKATDANNQAMIDTGARSAQVAATAQERLLASQAKTAKVVGETVAAEQKKIAAARKQADASASRAAKTSVLTDPAQQQKLVHLAEEVGRANEHATDLIRTGYQTRADAATKLERIQNQHATVTKLNEAQMAEATEKHAAAVKKLADLEASLKTAPFGRANQRIGGQITQQKRRVSISDTDLSAARHEFQALKNDIDTKLAETVAQSTAAIATSLREEELALHRVDQAIRAQAAEYQRLAKIAGPSVQSIAKATEASARGVADQARKVAKINQELAAHQQSSKGLEGAALQKAADKQAEIVQRYTKSMETLNALNQAHVANSQRMHDQLAAIGTADADRAAADVQKLIDVQAAGDARILQIQTERAEAELAINKAGNDAILADKIASEAQLTATAEAEAAARVAAAEEEQAQTKAIRSRLGQQVMAGAAKGALILGVAIAGATASFVSFDEQMHNVASIADDTGQVFGEMTDGVKALSRELGQSPTDLAKALYDIVSSGFDGADAMDLLRASARAAVAGMSDVATTGKSLTAVINAYKNANEKVALSIKDVGKVSDIAFAAVKEGVFSFEELTQQQGDNLSLAAELNVSYEELAAAYVVLTRAGNSLSESTTQVNGILRTFLKPNEDLADAVEAYGEEVLHVSNLTGAALVQNYGFAASMEAIDHATHGSAAELGKLFPNVRALRGEIGVGGRNLQEYNKQLLNMIRAGKEGTFTQNALNIQMEAAAFKFRIAREEIRSAAITLGASFAPAMVFVAKRIGELGDAFNDLPKATQSMIGGFIGITTLILGSVVAIGKVIGSVRKARAEFKLLKTAIDDSVVATKVLAALSSPIGLLVTGIALLTVGAVIAHQRQEKAAKELKDTYEDLIKTIDILKASGTFTGDEAQRATDLVDALTTAASQREMLGPVDIDKMAHELEDATTAAHEANAEFVEFKGHKLTFEEANDALARYAKANDVLWGGLKEEATPAIKALTDLLDTEGVSISAVTKEIGPLIAEWLLGLITIDDLTNAIKEANDNPLIVFDKSADDLEKLTDMGTQLNSLDTFFTDTGESADAFRAAMKGFTGDLEVMTGQAFDLSSPLAFVQQQIESIGDTTAQTLLKLADLGRVRFDEAELAVLKAAAAVDTWQQQIDKLNEEISKSSQEISRWQQQQNLVADTVGTQADGYAKLNEMVERGKISRAEANEITKAAIFLNQEATIGIENEHVEMAKSLIPMAAFVDGHRIAVEKYKELEPAAQGFADALADQRKQAMLMTIIMAKLANFMSGGKVFPDEMLTKLILNTAQFDPAMAAILDEFGLLPEEVKTQITLEVSPESMEAVHALRVAAEEELAQLTGASGRLIRPEDAKRIRELEGTIRSLTTKEQRISIELAGGAGGELTDLSGQLAEGEVAATAIGEAFKNAGKEAANLDDEVAAVIPDLLRVATGALDLSDPFAFVQKKMHLVRDSFATVLLHAQTAGKVRFTKAEESALHWQSALDGVNAGLERIGGEIDQNQSDISMWEGRISLVDDTIGSATDTLSAYEAQLARGEITQQEFNEAVASGEAHEAYAKLNQLVREGRLTQEQADDVLRHAIHLRERSVGGILDERAEMALAIIDLDNYVTAHDHLNGKYKDLTSEQKGFLNAMKDEAVQTALNTVLMLSFLEAMGQIAPGAAKQFAEIAAAGNEAVAAVFEDINLDFTVNVDADTTDADKALDPYRPGDGTGVVRVAENEIAITADTTQAKTAIDGLTQHAQEQVAILLEHGTSAGIAWVDGFVAGQEFEITQVGVALNSLTTRMQQQIQTNRTYGYYGGQAYDFGVADGVYKNASHVSAAGDYLGRLLHFSFKNAIVSKSPSKLGAEGGTSYVDGVIQGLQNNAQRAQQASQSLAKAVHTGFSKEIATFKGDVRAGQPMTPSQLGGRGLSATARHGGNTAVVQHNQFGDVHVSGAGDPKAVAAEVQGQVWDQLVGSMRRLESAVG